MCRSLNEGPVCRARLVQEGVPRAPEMQGQQALTCRTVLQERHSACWVPRGTVLGQG